jgi:LacI family transcriptional regulator, gluconate utilization system Gnt-I transcriptional repressor
MPFSSLARSFGARQQLLAARIPVVESWDLTPSPIDIVIGFSHGKVGRAAAKPLLAKGYKRVAVLAATDVRALQRRDGFLAERADHSVTDVAMLVNSGALKLGREAFTQLQSRAASLDAVFWTSDPLANGMTIEAQACSLAVPGDLAVMGFGDFSSSSYPRTSLSTSRIDRRKIGRIASQAILAELSGSERPDVPATSVSRWWVEKARNPIKLKCCPPNPCTAPLCVRDVITRPLIEL